MVLVDVFLKGRLLAQYNFEDEILPLQEAENGDAIIVIAKQNLLRDRLVDDLHLGELTFAVRRS